MVEDMAAASRVVIVGDAATSRDLRISRLAVDGCFAEVDARHGADLAADTLDGSLSGAQVVHLVGAVEPGTRLSLFEDGPGARAARIADACAMGGAVCATLPGPVSGPDGRALVGALLPGLRGGVLAQRWTPDGDSVLLPFLGAAAGAFTPGALVDALGAARRRAICEGHPPAEWAAYELYLAET